VSRFLTAATRPLHVLPTGVGAVGAAGLLAMGLAPLAVALGVLSVGTWGALTAWELATPPKAPPPPPDPLDGIRSADLRDQLRAVIEAAERVRVRIEGHDGVLDSSLAEILAEQRDLVQAAITTARRGDAVWRLLGSIDPNLLRREIAERRDAARRASDPAVARSLDEAAAAKEREMETWRGLAGLVDRIRAELVAADAGLDELHARVVRLTLDDPAAVLDADVHGQLRSMAARLQGLERSVDDTLKEMA
jgi:hypothetical protein